MSTDATQQAKGDTSEDDYLAMHYFTKCATYQQSLLPIEGPNGFAYRQAQQATRYAYNKLSPKMKLFLTGDAQ